MSNTENTHWKNLKDNAYLGGYSLMTNGSKHTLIVKISHVTKEAVIDIMSKDNSKKDCLVVHLVNQKPFVCNSVNAKAIETVVGSPYVGDWEGKLIELECQRVRAFGKFHDVLRVRPVAPVPPPKPDLNVGHKNWEICLKALIEGQTTIEKLQSKYTINDEHLNILKDAK